ncbi:substrate-binding domain-containing protein [Phormidium tenue FACHB-886]|nr:substrate-binding domain-containing protein [Phormidium tenue FACHB-886]
MKKLWRNIVLAATVLFLIVACRAAQAPDTTTASSPAASPAGGGSDFAMVTINQQALFFNQMIDGARKAAGDTGVNVTVFNANNDPAAQNTAIENYIEQKVNGLVVVAIDVEGIKPAIQKAADAGIPVVAVDAVVNSPAVKVQVGVDNGKAGEQIGAFVNEWAQRNNVTGAQIGVIGALNSAIQIQRQDSFTKTVEQAGHRILQVVDGQNVQETAQRAAEDLFTANPNMTVAYATGEPAMIGAVAAARSQNVTDRVALFGWDLAQSVIQGIDDGFVAGVVQQDPYTEGVEAVNALVKLQKGETVINPIDVPIVIVTQENVEQFRAQFK